MTATEGIRTRTYGARGPVVYVLHGGPAAVGLAQPIAVGLSDRFRAIEPFQRGSSHVPLTVAQHISDLDALIEARKETITPAIVGHSWGAMLALAYAAAHPDKVKGLVLIGCGTFDEASRDKMNRTIAERIDTPTKRLLDNLPEEYPDLGDRLKAKHDLIGKVHDYDAVQAPQDTKDIESFDMNAHTETWNDMLRLQQNGTYPSAFASIRAPVLMLHGSYDPHPGTMIYKSLKPHIRRMEYVELPQCGHEPWREKNARVRFFQIMKDWIATCFESSSGET